jgi:hypothetical protein
MLRVMVECKNVRSEKIAKYLTRLTNGFKLWIHDNAVYALFDIDSLLELKELSKRLKRIKSIEFKYVKIQTVLNYET